MSDYPSSSPWGPHGPQVSEPSVTPNPTAPDPQPSFQTFDPGPTPSASYSGGTGFAGPTGPVGSGRTVFSGSQFGTWMRKLAIAGSLVGCFVGAARGFALHLPPAIIGILIVRLGVAGAATGASIPPAFRAAGSVIRAAVWIVLAAILWAIAMAAAGQMGWLNQLR